MAQQLSRQTKIDEIRDRLTAQADAIAEQRNKEIELKAERSQGRGQATRAKNLLAETKDENEAIRAKMQAQREKHAEEAQARGVLHDLQTGLDNDRRAQARLEKRLTAQQDELVLAEREVEAIVNAALHETP